jgi:hypothetical protein
VTRRLLEPTERFSEILFGLIMVLTFTCTLSVGEAGRADVREMLVGALGCNLAWGIVDGVMYVLNALTLRGRGTVLLHRLRSVSDPGGAHALIAAAVPERIAAVLGPEDYEAIRRRLLARRDPPHRMLPSRRDMLGAGSVCLLVFLSTLPVTIPFMVIPDPRPALRVSNVIALVMLYLLGHSVAKYTGASGWRLGLGMLALGIVLVAITIALGG